MVLAPVKPEPTPEPIPVLKPQEPEEDPWVNIADLLTETKLKDLGIDGGVARGILASSRDFEVTQGVNLDMIMQVI